MRKRSKYRPKGVLINPMGYVMDGFAPITSHAEHVLDLQIKNHSAMVALLQGRAEPAHMGILIAMYNITEALHKLGIGAEYSECVTAGRQTLTNIVHRSHKVGKYVPTGPEIESLNLLLDLHDAQVRISTVRDMDRALRLTKREIDSGRATNLRKAQ